MRPIIFASLGLALVACNQVPTEDLLERDAMKIMQEGCRFIGGTVIDHNNHEACAQFFFECPHDVKIVVLEHSYIKNKHKQWELSGKCS